MKIYKTIVILSVLIFTSCKNDASVTTTPPTSATPPVNTTTPSTRPADAVAKAAEKPTSQETANTGASREKAGNSGSKIDTVTVSSLEDLVANAKSNSVIYLKKGKYELESHLVYYMTKDERRIINKNTEQTQSIGGQLFFYGLNNFQIIGEKGSEIVSKSPEAVGFFVIKCNNVKVSNLIIKKEVSGKSDLCYVASSQEVEVDNCTFDGGGTYGLYISNVTNIKVNNSKISKSTTGAIRVNASKGVAFNNTTFSNNMCMVPVVNIYGGGSDLAFNNVKIIDNKKNPKSTFNGSDKIFASINNTIKLNNCTIKNNVGYKHLGLDPSSISKSRIDEVSIP